MVGGGMQPCKDNETCFPGRTMGMRSVRSVTLRGFCKYILVVVCVRACVRACVRVRVPVRVRVRVCGCVFTSPRVFLLQD